MRKSPVKGRKPKKLVRSNTPVDNLRAPGWFTHRQKLLWRRAIESAPKGLLHLMDWGVLTNWVIAADTFREACEKSRGVGLIVKSPNKGQPMQNPYLPIINRQSELMMKAAGSLGFDPVSRTRLIGLDAGRTKPPAAGTAGKVLGDEPMGKKAAANAAAVTAAAGTAWDSVLPGTTTPQ